MSLLDQMPPELRTKLRAQAENDLKEIQKTINDLIDEACKDSDFDSHMSLMSALLLAYIHNPTRLSMIAAEAVFMLAEERKNK